MRRPRLRRMQVLGVCLLAVLTAGCGGDSDSSDTDTDPKPIGTDANGTKVLEPGRYVLSANGALDQPRAVVTVPKGLTGYGGFGVGVFPDSARPDNPYRTLTYWTVGEVFPDPCHRKDGGTDAGTTVDDLVKAFRTQKPMRMTTPKPMTIDGHAGVQFDLVAPTDVDFAECDDDRYVLWASPPGGGRFLQEPGQLLRMRVLDVDGHRVVVSTSANPEAEAEFAAIDALAPGITFLPPESDVD